MLNFDVISFALRRGATHSSAILLNENGNTVGVLENEPPTNHWVTHSSSITPNALKGILLTWTNSDVMIDIVIAFGNGGKF